MGLGSLRPWRHDVAHRSINPVWFWDGHARACGDWHQVAVEDGIVGYGGEGCVVGESAVSLICLPCLLKGRSSAKSTYFSVSLVPYL